MKPEMVVGQGTWLGSIPAQTGTRHLYLDPDPDPEKLKLLASKVDEQCRPLSKRAIVELISRLVVLCRVRSIDATELKLYTRFLQIELQKFPGDAVTKALTAWPDTSKFLPTWAELKEKILHYCWARLKMRDKLHAIMA